jgi:putative acetyltransferase
MNNISSEVVNLLRMNARSVVRELGLLNDDYFEIGVTLAERHLLIELSSCHYPTVGEIAERLLLDKSTASRLIAKAVKKGYVEYSSDENDKRKRFLQLTSKGIKIRNAVEPIAFSQTRDALLTLSTEEVEMVYRGMALYGKGLKISRLKNKVIFEKITQKEHATVAHMLAVSNYNQFEDYEKVNAAYFVMKMDSKIIAGVGISSEDLISCSLEKIFMHSNMAHKGFETILIDHAIQEANKMNYKKCTIDISKETLIETDFFLKLGFQYKNNKTKTLIWKAC